MILHHSLRFRISLLFVLLMLAGNILALVLINRNVTIHYSSYVNQSDRQKALTAARILQDSWEEWSSELHEGDHRLPLSAPPSQNIDEGEDNRMRLGFMPGHRSNISDERMMIRNEQAPMIIVDEQGKTLLSTFSENRKITEIKYKDGIPVKINNAIVAYVLSGSMITQKMNPADLRMLGTINRTLISSSLFSTLAILLLGFFLLERMLSPLKRIDRAATNLAEGDMKARTGLLGYDEISQLGIRFDSMAGKLEESDEWKRRIIADTAHELRTPAALMQSRLEMLRDGIYQADTKQLNSLHREAENFSRLISEMQKLSSMEGSGVKLEKERADLNSLCTSRIETFMPATREKEVKLTWNGLKPGESTAPLTVLFDWNRVDQILKNILSNALYHTPKEGEIDVSTKKLEDSIVIYIADSGPGIPREEREKIFDRFYRLDAGRNRKEGGHGLGLAISQAIARAHGGNISVKESSLGGALFCVELPL